MSARSVLVRPLLVDERDAIDRVADLRQVEVVPVAFVAVLDQIPVSILALLERPSEHARRARWIEDMRLRSLAVALHNVVGPAQVPTRPQPNFGKQLVDLRSVGAVWQADELAVAIQEECVARVIGHKSSLPVARDLGYAKRPADSEHAIAGTRVIGERECGVESGAPGRKLDRQLKARRPAIVVGHKGATEATYVAAALREAHGERRVPGLPSHG